MDEDFVLSDFGYENEDKKDDLALYAVVTKPVVKDDTNEVNEELSNTQELIVEPDYE
jgi:hypothetical protein